MKRKEIETLVTNLTMLIEALPPALRLKHWL